MNARHGNGNGHGNGNWNGNGNGNWNDDWNGNGNGNGHGWRPGLGTNPVDETFNRYFHEGQYLQNKVEALNAQSTDGKIWTAEEVRAICAQAGMTPMQHFNRYGAFEINAEGTWGINPSADFDLNAYYDAKSSSLIGAGHNPEHVAWVVEQFKNGNADPLTHFGMYGQHENMNPTAHGCMNANGCWMTQQNTQQAQQAVELAGVQADVAPVAEPA